MPAIATRSTMTPEEARDCINAIKYHVDSARKFIFVLHERRGWRSLGYKSWRNCVTAEFSNSSSHLYRQLRAAQIEREISPMGEIGTIPEGQLRELVSVPEGERKATWELAVDSAPNGKVTAKHLQAVVFQESQSGYLPRERVSETGLFYLINLDQRSIALRVKLGFTIAIDKRLSHHRTTNPTAAVVGVWPSLRRWEASAIDSATRLDCRLIGGEVYEVDNMDGLISRIDNFFDLMPDAK